VLVSRHPEFRRHLRYPLGASHERTPEPGGGRPARRHPVSARSSIAPRNAPFCVPATLHEALALSCRAAFGSWTAGAATATAALTLVTSALDAFCDAASSVAASSTPALPGGSQ
jgi:hypothetical protein